MWSSDRKMTGFEKKNVNSSRTVDNVHDYVNDLNKFYCRFACHDFHMNKTILVAFYLLLSSLPSELNDFIQLS